MVVGWGREIPAQVGRAGKVSAPQTLATLAGPGEGGGTRLTGGPEEGTVQAYCRDTHSLEPAASRTQQSWQSALKSLGKLGKTPVLALKSGKTF